MRKGCNPLPPIETVRPKPPPAPPHKRDYLFDRVQAMRVMKIDEDLFYLVKVGSVISNGEHFKHDFKQLVRHFITLLDEDEMLEMSESVIKNLYDPESECQSTSR